MKRKNTFASGIGDGIGESFFSLEDKELQEKLLDITNTNEDDDTDFSSFPVRFGIQLGMRITNQRFKIQKEMQEQILKSIGNDVSFTKGIAFGFGLSFKEMDNKAQKFILDKINEKISLNLYIGFSNGIRYIFIEKDKEIQKFILDKINENKIFSLILGSSLGLFLFTKIELQTINHILNTNNWISWGIGQRVGVSLNELESHLNSIWELIKSNKSFCEGFCYGIANYIRIIKI